jgi:hypothetical protein
LIVKFLFDNYLTLSNEGYADILETALTKLNKKQITEPFGQMVNKIVFGEELKESIIT